MREYLFVDLDLPSGIRRYWSGDIAETFVSALPAAGEYEYTPIDYIEVRPFQAALDRRTPSLQLELALSVDDPVFVLLRTTQAPYGSLVRTADTVAAPPALVATAAFLGNVKKSTLVDGRFVLTVEHFMSRLDTDPPDPPAMSDVAQRRLYPDDVGFAVMGATHQFLAGWPN